MRVRVAALRIMDAGDEITSVRGGGELLTILRR
jgi:hypothetical protein